MSEPNLYDRHLIAASISPTLAGVEEELAVLSDALLDASAEARLAFLRKCVGVAQQLRAVDTNLQRHATHFRNEHTVLPSPNIDAESGVRHRLLSDLFRCLVESIAAGHWYAVRYVQHDEPAPDWVPESNPPRRLRCEVSVLPLDGGAIRVNGGG